MKQQSIYRCTACGASLHAPVLAALAVPEATEQCPGCGRWARVVLEAAKKLIFGEKAA